MKTIKISELIAKRQELFEELSDSETSMIRGGGGIELQLSSPIGGSKGINYAIVVTGTTRELSEIF